MSRCPVVATIHTKWPTFFFMRIRSEPRDAMAKMASPCQDRHWFQEDMWHSQVQTSMSDAGVEDRQKSGGELNDYPYWCSRSLLSPNPTPLVEKSRKSRRRRLSAAELSTLAQESRGRRVLPESGSGCLHMIHLHLIPFCHRGTERKIYWTQCKK